MKKSSKNTTNQRVSEVSEMLIKGQTRSNIFHYTSVNWKVGARQVDNYIAKARVLIQNDIIKNLEYDYAKAIKRYESLYNRALDLEDYRLAFTINKELTNLQGLNKIKIEHSGNIEFISNIPD